PDRGADEGEVRGRAPQAADADDALGGHRRKPRLNGDPSMTAWHGRMAAATAAASPLRRTVWADQEQRLAKLDELTVGHQDLLDRAGDLGLDAGEDLHDLEQPDRTTCLDPA